MQQLKCIAGRVQDHEDHFDASLFDGLDFDLDMAGPEFAGLATTAAVH